jgi:hypothetical protein
MFVLTFRLPISIKFMMYKLDLGLVLLVSR